MREVKPFDLMLCEASVCEDTPRPGFLGQSTRFIYGWTREPRGAVGLPAGAVGDTDSTSICNRLQRGQDVRNLREVDKRIDFGATSHHGGAVSPQHLDGRVVVG